MEKGVERSIERGKFNIDVGLRVLRLNDSMATMSLISPQHWQEFIFPHMKTVCDELHHYCPDVRIYCHICGNVLPIIHLLEEVGLDCIAPLDPLGNFTVAQARAAAGDRMVLMGGINTISFIQSDEPTIAAEAQRCIDEGVVGGGHFILGSGCALPRTSTLENLTCCHKCSATTVGFCPKNVVQRNQPEGGGSAVRNARNAPSGLGFPHRPGVIQFKPMQLQKEEKSTMRNFRIFGFLLVAVMILAACTVPAAPAPPAAEEAAAPAEAAAGEGGEVTFWAIKSFVDAANEAIIDELHNSKKKTASRSTSNLCPRNTPANVGGCDRVRQCARRQPPALL